jgi:signal transduction histidine kinase
MKRRPLVFSLALLVLGSGAVAWIAAFALLLITPRPIEAGTSINEVVAALNGPSSATGAFRRTYEASPPIDRGDVSTERVIEARIAAALQPPREVRVSFQSFMFRDPERGVISIGRAIESGSLQMIGGVFAARNPDGSWTVLRTAGPLLTAWHLKMLGAFALLGLLLAPFAFFVARRLAHPLRRIAAWAGQIDLAAADPIPRVGGPAELQQVAAALEEMRERLTRQVRERTVMLAAVAHDLRTPLTALRVRTEAAPEAARDAMNCDIDRMEAMISQFLHFVSGAGEKTEPQIIDLADLVATVIAEAAEAGLAVSHAAQAELLVKADPLELRRMLRNLIDNAVRFGASAQVMLHQARIEAVIVVIDEGPGLPEEELERVFQPFYRPDDARNSATGGAGLGLAIVRTIARAHRGEALLRNRLGGGLEAEVRLPVLEPARG